VLCLRLLLLAGLCMRILPLVVHDAAWARPPPRRETVGLHVLRGGSAQQPPAPTLGVASLAPGGKLSEQQEKVEGQSFPALSMPPSATAPANSVEQQPEDSLKHGYRFSPLPVMHPRNPQVFFVEHASVHPCMHMCAYIYMLIANIFPDKYPFPLLAPANTRDGDLNRPGLQTNIHVRVTLTHTHTYTQWKHQAQRQQEAEFLLNMQEQTSGGKTAISGVHTPVFSAAGNTNFLAPPSRTTPTYGYGPGAAALYNKGDDPGSKQGLSEGTQTQSVDRCRFFFALTGI